MQRLLEQFTRERLENLASGNAFTCIQDDEAALLAQIALAAMDGKYPVIPDGWILIPAKASQQHLNSIAMRYRHDFYLLPDNQKNSALATARQMYEECSGQGFYSILKPE